mmetsp:Transcript_17371/g.39413  ORF Transcript_17371/g.39413 Transcript_17371/m.39413 type:complete len:277 (+) Transcript_17371:825-1655(+)|eukprot:764433-Hanusia_phi.AAC.2
MHKLLGSDRKVLSPGTSASPFFSMEADFKVPAPAAFIVDAQQGFDAGLHHPLPVNHEFAISALPAEAYLPGERALHLPHQPCYFALVRQQRAVAQQEGHAANQNLGVGLHQSIDRLVELRNGGGVLDDFDNPLDGLAVIALHQGSKVLQLGRTDLCILRLQHRHHTGAVLHEVCVQQGAPSLRVPLVHVGSMSDERLHALHVPSACRQVQGGRPRHEGGGGGKGFVWHAPSLNERGNALCLPRVGGVMESGHAVLVLEVELSPVLLNPRKDAVGVT